MSCRVSHFGHYELDAHHVVVGVEANFEAIDDFVIVDDVLVLATLHIIYIIAVSAQVIVNYCKLLS